MDKDKTIPTLSKTAVSDCFSIDDRKPKKGQEIMYKGNLGFSKGTYRNFDKNIGWVILPDGGVDCFDQWRKFKTDNSKN